MTGGWSRAMLLVTAVTISFSLVGCNKRHREKEAAAFGQACGRTGFSPQQCSFLYAMRQDARDRADDSDALALVGLNAATVAAINATRH